jgi:signal peptidase I
VPDLVLDYHRLRVPIDHPDQSVTRTKLEYPTADVSFAYLASINKTGYVSHYIWGYLVVTGNSFTDKAVWQAVQSNDYPTGVARLQNYMNDYFNFFNLGASTADHRLLKIVNATQTTLATEAVDLDAKGRGLAISCSGSTINSLRYEMLSPIDPLSLPTATATLSATDTSFASGLYGFRFLRDTYTHGGSESGSAWLKAPLSPLPPAQAILELNIEGNGRDTPFAPSLGKNLVEVSTLTGLPDFLYLEAKKYQVLRARGFTDEEMKLVFGYVPQHQVDLDSVTWGSFEFHPDKVSTIIITIVGDNPYSPGAIERQKAKAKRAFGVPKDYNEAVGLYNQLKKDYPHWLAGVHNWCYQIFGLEEFDLFQNADFYYGELLEHKTHYDQLRQVPDWEMWRRLSELRDRLSKVSVLVDERDKHLKKVDEILRKGW